MCHKNVEFIGQTATFYIPETKNSVIEETLHNFFLTHYNAYTAESSDIQGYWRRDANSPIFSDRNVKYIVSFDGREKIDPFIDFLSGVCSTINEECIYLTMGMKSFLVKPNEQT